MIKGDRTNQIGTFCRVGHANRKNFRRRIVIENATGTRNATHAERQRFGGFANDIVYCRHSHGKTAHASRDIQIAAHQRHAITESGGAIVSCDRAAATQTKSQAGTTGSRATERHVVNQIGALGDRRAGDATHSGSGYRGNTDVDSAGGSAAIAITDSDHKTITAVIGRIRRIGKTACRRIQHHTAIGGRSGNTVSQRIAIGVASAD